MHTIFFPQVFCDINWTLNLFFNTKKKVLEVLEIQVFEIHLYWKYTTFENISSTLSVLELGKVVYEKFTRLIQLSLSLSISLLFCVCFICNANSISGAVAESSLECCAVAAGWRETACVVLSLIMQSVASPSTAIRNNRQARETVSIYNERERERERNITDHKLMFLWWNRDV